MNFIFLTFCLFSLFAHKKLSCRTHWSVSYFSFVFYRLNVFSNKNFFFLFTIYFHGLLFAPFIHSISQIITYCLLFGCWAKKRNYSRKKMNSSVDFVHVQCTYIHDKFFWSNAFNVFMHYLLLLSSVLFFLLLYFRSVCLYWQ